MNWCASSWSSITQLLSQTGRIRCGGPVPPDRLSAHCLALLSQIATCEVANRPGRIEPRVLRRRRHNYKLMQEPRHVLKNRLESGNAKA